MDKVHEGWLTKSPPDWKRHVSIFKLKKWRRRYFVLYSPPESCIIPGTCDAQLCYYENESLSKECGRIDLKNCEEIISQLETDDFRNVLALKTVFRNQSRIYYLAADTEEDLDRWMDKISYVLNISGDEFIEVNQKEEVEDKKKVSCRSKPESKAKAGDKPRSKLSGVSLRRSSSSILSKSSTSINLLASKQNRTLPGHSPVFSPAAKYQKFAGSQSDCLSLSPAGEMASEFDSTLTRSTNIRSKPSFLNKIRQLKSPSTRRPSCPLIIPQPLYTDESAAASVLRPNASKQNTMRFHGSSGSSIISYNSDYKTPDISSPTMPPLFHFKKYDTSETSLRIESKLSLLSSPDPPPLPPKVRSSDSGLPDENNALSTCPIYDIPAHNYGSYKEDDEDDDNDDIDPGYIKDRLMELEGMTRFEGICLSVVDEREDEGLENDRCPSLEEQVFKGIPPPLPERRKPGADSSDSEYDILPFARRQMKFLQEVTSVTRPQVESDDDDSDDSDNYDVVPVRRMIYDDLEPPPLPERKRLTNADSNLGMSVGDRSSDSVDDISYDRIADEGKRLPDDDILSDALIRDRPLKNVDDPKLAELSNHLAKNLLLPRNRLLVRLKSKSLENIKEKDTSSDFSADENRKSTMEEDKIVRMTLKTRSFKRKSGDKTQFDESISSLGSSSSPSTETSQPLIVNDNSLY